MDHLNQLFQLTEGHTLATPGLKHNASSHVERPNFSESCAASMTAPLT